MQAGIGDLRPGTDSAEADMPTKPVYLALARATFTPSQSIGEWHIQYVPSPDVQLNHDHQSVGGD